MIIVGYNQSMLFLFKRRLQSIIPIVVLTTTAISVRTTSTSTRIQTASALSRTTTTTTTFVVYNPTAVLQRRRPRAIKFPLQREEVILQLQPQPRQQQQQQQQARMNAEMKDSDLSTDTGNTSDSWGNYREQVIDKCILPLSYQTSYKGSSGRVAIIGGNELYVGAPYFAGMAALHTGVDLVSIYTAHEATIPMKCFSPDLMIQSIYHTSDLSLNIPDNDNDTALNTENTTTDNTTTNLANDPIVTNIVHITIRYLQERRIHCVVIGPGMGRHPMIMEAVAQIIQQVKNQLYMILDADALYMLSLVQYRHVLQDNHKVILTPNQMEYQRLFGTSNMNSSHDDNNNNLQLDSAIIVQKGFVDRIYYKNHTPQDRNDENESSPKKYGYHCTELGGMKRCGGIGDVLAGTISTFVTWQVILRQQQEQQQQQQQQEQERTNRTNNSNENDIDISVDRNTHPDHDDVLLLACYAACCLVKRATKKAYDQKNRAVLAQDVINAIGPTFQEMMK